MSERFAHIAFVTFIKLGHSRLLNGSRNKSTRVPVQVPLDGCQRRVARLPRPWRCPAQPSHSDSPITIKLSNSILHTENNFSWAFKFRGLLVMILLILLISACLFTLQPWRLYEQFHVRCPPVSIFYLYRQSLPSSLNCKCNFISHSVLYLFLCFFLYVCILILTLLFLTVYR